MKIPPFKDTFKTPEIVFCESMVTGGSSLNWERGTAKRKVSPRKRILRKMSVN